MKNLSLLIIVLFSLTTKANDTLTRAQVYNFSVGDTFDYRYYVAIEVEDPPGGVYSYTESTSYSRLLVTNISYSLDSQTRYIQRERIFPLPDSLEILTLTNLSGYEVFLDTCNGCPYYNISMGPISQYNGRSIDTLNQFAGSPGNEELIFVDGLGCVINNLAEGGCGPCGGSSLYSTTLIYYAGGNETWGTPYYDLPSAVEQINALNHEITLFPTLNDGNFAVKMQDAGLLPINMIIYDITGQKIQQISLNNLNNEISIGPHSTGVYLWKASSGNLLIQTGKMVVH